MLNLSRFVGPGLAVGLLGLALLAPGQTFAQSSSAPPAPYYPSTSTYDTGNPILRDRFGYGFQLDLLASNGRYRDDVMQNRVIVHLRDDALTTDGRLEPMERGLAEGTKVSSFDPSDLEITTGTTVTFWADSGHHALECSQGNILPQSMPLTSGQIYSYTFLEAGVYRIRDGFAAGPTGYELPGLRIRIHGHSKTMADVYPGLVAPNADSR